MKIYTYQEARLKLQKDMDIEDEVFIDDDELISYFNEAIDEAEAIIHDLHEDYFLTSDFISLVNGQAEYDMPADCYANKIRLLFYDSGGKRFKIERAKLEEVNYLDRYAVNDFYAYTIQNATAGTAAKMVFHPVVNETSTDHLRRWYIRNANRVVDDTSTIDIPEFINFIWAYVRERVSKKEASPMYPTYASDVPKQEMRMRSTLDQMVLDNDKTIDPDMSFYNEFNDEDWWGAY